MVHKQILFVLVTLAAAWLLGDARANAQTVKKSSSPSLLERVDRFGVKVVDGIFSKLPGSQSSTQREQQMLDDDATPRAGSAIRPAKSLDAATPTTPSQPSGNTNSSPSGMPPYEAYPTRAELTASTPEPTPESSQPRVPLGASPWNAPGNTSGPMPPSAGDPPVAASVSSAPTTGGLVVRNTTITENQPVGGPNSSVSGQSGPSGTTAPLHQRLARFRQSVFGNAPTETQPSDVAPAQPAAVPSRAAAAPTTAPPRQAARQVPTLAPRRPVESSVAPSEPEPNPAAGPSLTEQTPTRAPEQPSHPATVPMVESVAEAHPSVPETSSPAVPDAAGVASVSGDPSPRDEQVLLTRRSPVLNVQTLGPARIAVGKQSTYEVHVENSGDVAANDVVVTMALPDWADVVGSEATSGAIFAEPGAGGGRQLVWKIGPMEAKVRQKATLAIVPRQSRPIDLAVRWDFTPITSQTVIQVEEPKLNLRLAGPREVRFGEPQLFKLELSNTGNGAADQLVLTMMPLVPGEGAPMQHRLGTLAAGERKVIDMELVARNPGSLAVQMELRSDGPARAQLNETLLVRKANVEVAVDAPKVQFTGAVATYRIRVRNSGNASAEDVRLVAKIPPEAKLIAAGNNGQAASDGQSVQWKLDRLAEGTEQELSVQCQLAREGYTQMKVEAIAKQVSAEATAVTRVESIADLALEVCDPSGPVPLGQTADYTITIHNRGTKDASDVEAVVYFSQGIEPVSAKGAPFKLQPGQVLFDSIGVVPAGKKVVLKIAAHAQAAGNHMFRAEVYCRPLGTKLVGEETTHFYQGDFDLPGQRPMLGATAPQEENPPQTADRRNQPTMGPPVGSPAPIEPAPARY